MNGTHYLPFDRLRANGGEVRLARIASNPVLLGTVLGGQHPFAGLQADAVSAFDAFQNAFGFLAAIGDDFGELFQQGFGHNRMFNQEMNTKFISK